MPSRLKIAIDCPDPEALGPFWQQALGYDRVGDRPPDSPYVELLPPRSLPAEVFLQQVPDLGHRRTRIHLDLYVPDPKDAITRLEALGASRVGEWVGGDDGFHVMEDPQGTVFCVCAEV